MMSYNCQVMSYTVKGSLLTVRGCPIGDVLDVLLLKKDIPQLLCDALHLSCHGIFYSSTATFAGCPISYSCQGMSNS